MRSPGRPPGSGVKTPAKKAPGAPSARVHHPTAKTLTVEYSQAGLGSVTAHILKSLLAAKGVTGMSGKAKEVLVATLLKYPHREAVRLEHRTAAGSVETVTIVPTAHSMSVVAPVVAVATLAAPVATAATMMAPVMTVPVATLSSPVLNFPVMPSTSGGARVSPRVSPRAGASYVPAPVFRQ